MSSHSADAFVFFGATGDLAYKQIFPSLQRLVRDDGLTVPIIGVARRDWSDDRLRARARESLEASGGVDETAFAKLAPLLHYVRGDYECEVHVNGKKAPELAVPGNDMRFRWRNWPYVIPADLAVEPILRVDVTPSKADRDVNIFKVWVYQPK